MAGLIGHAPIYANGVLSLLFVFVLPGLALASLVRIPEFPQRWFAIFLGSLIANHVLVTLIAAFRLDPLLSYRLAACIVVLVLLAAAIVRRLRRSAAAGVTERPTLSASDLGWLLASLMTVAVAYFNVWKHGVPNIFTGGDVLVSWNAWAQIWAQGAFPVNAYGYPQFIPTLWAVTYIFTGSPEQYFAFYIYVGLIVLPILLNALILGRMSWWCPIVSGLAFIWFIAEIRAPWLRSTLEEGFPDWVAAIFASSGAVLFIFNDPDGRFDRDKIANALLALGLVSIAAAIKPLHGLLALAVLAGICTDAAKYLGPAERNRFLLAAVGLLAVPVITYAIYYAHLANPGIPSFPVSAVMSERLSSALAIFNSNFTIPFRIAFVLGVVLSPFVKRVRWFALPLCVAIATWANTSAYDLRNVLSFLMIGAFVPLYVAARRWLEPRALPRGRQWQMRDGLVAAMLALMAFGLTSPLAMGDRKLQRRFADDQLRIDAGIEINQKIGEVLNRGCRVFSPTGSFLFIVAFAPFRSQIHPYFYALPLDDALAGELNRSTGCTAVLYPLDRTHPSILNFVSSYARARGLNKVLESNGMELLLSPQ